MKFVYVCVCVMPCIAWHMCILILTIIIIMHTVNICLDSACVCACICMHKCMCTWLYAHVYALLCTYRVQRWNQQPQPCILPSSLACSCIIQMMTCISTPTLTWLLRRISWWSHYHTKPCTRLPQVLMQSSINNHKFNADYDYAYDHHDHDYSH